MPSPKAVLRDITDQDLHPGKAHRRCATDGRLAGGAAPAAEEPAKPALKQLAPEKPKPEPKPEKKPEPAKVELPKVEEKAPEVHVEAEVKPVEPPVELPKVEEEKKEEATSVKTEVAPEAATDDGKKKPAAKKADKPTS